MIWVLRAGDRHHLQQGGVDFRFTFEPRESPERYGEDSGMLLNLAEIRIPPGRGFKSAMVQEEEIITYLHRGTLAQAHASGSSVVIHAGEFQRMRTGHGFRQKETNASLTDWAHVFRISLSPSVVETGGMQQQRRFPAALRHNKPCMVVSPDGRGGSLPVHQPVFVYSSELNPGHHMIHELLSKRTAWLHIVYGEATLHDIILTQGDGAGVTQEPSVSLTAKENTEILLVDASKAPGFFALAQ